MEVVHRPDGKPTRRAARHPQLLLHLPPVRKPKVARLQVAEVAVGDCRPVGAAAVKLRLDDGDDKPVVVDKDRVRRRAGTTDCDRFALAELQVRHVDAAACHAKDRLFGVATVCHRRAVELLDVAGKGRALAGDKVEQTTVGADADDHADLAGADRVAPFDQPRVAAMLVGGERLRAAAVGDCVRCHG